MWAYLPYTVLYKIFQHLEVKDLISVSEVCQFWYKVSRDDLLWKRLFSRSFWTPDSVPALEGRPWYEEYKRLCYHIPLLETETLHDHGHQVLHVSFSHNGKYFATCSKDGYVLVWHSGYPARIKYSKDMRTFSWKYTQFSQFNESDTLLLVSGVHFGSLHTTSGEIAVFSLEDGFELRCRVANKPYDIYGTWYNDSELLSGDLHWLAHLVSTSSLWLNKASQEVDSEHVPVTHNMFRFYNRSASSMRGIMVAKCLPGSEVALGKLKEKQENGKEVKNLAAPEIMDEGERAELMEYMRQRAYHGNQSESAWLAGIRAGNKPIPDDIPTSIYYLSEYRQAESNLGGTPVASSSSSYSAVSNRNSPENSPAENCLFERNIEDGRALGSESEQEDDEEDEQGATEKESSAAAAASESDKYLIFTTGIKTYTPHLVGFKRIKPFTFPQRMDPGPSLKERLVLHEQRKEQLRSGSPPPDLDWIDFDAVADKFDKVDHLIDLHGHIVGMALSPDHRFLYVNNRSWPVDYQISGPLAPPPIAQEIDIHVIDMVTLKEVGTMLRAHRAYTSNCECFFIFLDVSDQYVASGAEDKHGYLWDRHYGVCLTKFPHADVVNSVAFNPRDPEMLVTVSDDHLIKVWRSRAEAERLGLDGRTLPRGTEYRDTRWRREQRQKEQRQSASDSASNGGGGNNSNCGTS